MFLIYFAILIIIPIWAQIRVKRTYKKYSNVASSSNMRGAEVARKILDANGLYHVNIEEVRWRTYRIIMIHEQKQFVYHLLTIMVIRSRQQPLQPMNVGTLFKIKKHMRFMRLRHTLVPVANIGSNFSWILIIIGMIAGMSGFVLLGIIFMAAAVVFQLVTLPVEFNASSRAMDQCVSLGVIRNDEERETKKVLNAAALTYVAAAAVAVLELLRLILIYTGMQSDD